MKKKDKIEPINASFSKLAKMIVRTKISRKPTKKNKPKE